MKLEFAVLKYGSSSITERSVINNRASRCRFGGLGRAENQCQTTAITDSIYCALDFVASRSWQASKVKSSDSLVQQACSDYTACHLYNLLLNSRASDQSGYCYLQNPVLFLCPNPVKWSSSIEHRAVSCLLNGKCESVV